MKLRLFLVYIGIGLFAQAQLYTYRKFNHRQGLALSYVSALAQDENGFLWIGTDGAGLQRFDGRTIQKITPLSGETEHHISSIQADKKGVYFSSLYFGFFCLRNNRYEQIIGKDTTFGAHLLIRKKGELLVLCGARKMVIIRNNKLIKSYFFKSPIKQIIQTLDLPNGLLILTDRDQLLIENGQISSLQNHLDQGTFISAARFQHGKLDLFDFTKKTCYSILPDKIAQETFRLVPFAHQIPAPIKRVFSHNGSLLLVDSLNHLYHLKNEQFKYLPKNTRSSEFQASTLFIDRNDDYWLGTVDNGFFKISQAPFTKIELHPVYTNPLISFIYRTKQQYTVISTYNDETFIGSFNKEDFDQFKFRVFSQCEFQGKQLFATSDGIKVFENGKMIAFNAPLPRKKIIFIYSRGDVLYYSPDGDGLWQYSGGKTQSLSKAVSHVYTAQHQQGTGTIFFGTNAGVYAFHPKTGKAVRAPGINSGEYAGVSCKDVYGTLWFSCGKMIVGVLKNGKTVLLKDNRYFRSTLFYSLNSDQYGNLIIGTNEGISRLRVNAQGEVLNSVHYDEKNGFGGFETHMRSTFRTGDQIFFGTIEGLFVMNNAFLQNAPSPPKPFIFQSRNKLNTSGNLDDPITEVRFSVINPKLEGVMYSYRLRGKSERWSKPSPETRTFFSNLTDQDYYFEVRATYDGEHFSKISRIKISKFLPFWRSKWFILAIIFAIALANLAILDRSKSFEINQIIENQDIDISNRMRILIIAFGSVANISAQFLAVQLEGIKGVNTINWVFSFMLFFLFLISLRTWRNQIVNKYVLHAGMLLVLTQCYIGIYISNMHPFYLIVIVLAASLTPFILQRLNEVLIVSVVQIVTATALVLLIENALYNEILFIIAIFVSVSLSLFTTYIRNESLQKLIFISGMINKGNLLAMAFNRQGEITYMTENWYYLLNINPSFYLGKQLSDLNSHVDQHFVQEPVDFSYAFKHLEKVTVPIRGRNKEEIWIEWQVQKLNPSINVVFGQNVSERVKLESNYETLVENADDYIYFVDVNGHFIFANRNFKEKLGYSEEELIHRNSVLLAGKSYVDRVEQFYIRQFKERIPTTYYEFPIQRKDGSEIWVGQNTTLLFAPGSNKIVKGFLSLARDITDKRSQQQLIQEQHQKITDSISYARKIQESLLPSTQELELIFPDFHLFYQPRDQVSGDFYWVEQQGRFIYLVLADCTGHGVPGAFMTLLGTNLLNQLIGDKRLQDPGDILQELDRKLIEILSRSGEHELADGMEMVLLRFDDATGEILYAAAGAHFLTLAHNELTIHRGESKHIGAAAELNFKRYHSYELNPSQIEAFYLFTDGLTDQLSPEINKRFSAKRLMDLITKNSTQSLEFQTNAIIKKWHVWKNNAHQTDDVSLLIFRPRPR